MSVNAKTETKEPDSVLQKHKGARRPHTKDNAGHTTREVSKSRVCNISHKKLQHGLEKHVIPSRECYTYPIPMHEFLNEGEGGRRRDLLNILIIRFLIVL